jgi:CDP-glucose 4,6-dehydratase
MKNLINGKLGIFEGKSVLITGHTGFKGAWLTAWMKLLGANVTGIGLDPNTKSSHFLAAHMNIGINDLRIDVRDLSEITSAITSFKPDFVFHLAAQSLVKDSYLNPVDTWSTNVIGTVNILESLRKLDKKCVAIMVTSDKCYENFEWVWGYRENDRLGGKDPYSASKSAAEFAIKSYVDSFFNSSENQIRIASVRAGNVIGGGDWALNRIVPDFINSWTSGAKFEIRNPRSTRPWQHVLEPLSGYIVLAMELMVNPSLHGESFNFGPKDQKSYSVLDLVNSLSKNLDFLELQEQIKSTNLEKEAGLLKLNCDKAFNMLNWRAVMDFEQTTKMTATWYRSYYQDTYATKELTNNQILEYINFAKTNDHSWAK